MNQVFIHRMKEYLGSDEYEKFVASYSLKAKKAVIWNQKKINDSVVKDIDLDDVSGKCYLHHGGAIYISEPSAASVVSHLDIKGSDNVLDLCASPGGKSIQALNKLSEKDGGFLISNEVVVKRVKILSSNLERLGYKNVIITSDTPKNIADNFEGYFDKVIVDAPCSGEGLFRRDPDAEKEWSIENVKLCAARQKEILDEAYRCVKLGGKLLYSTCTFSKEEDEEVTKYFLEKHNDFKLIYEEKIMPHMNKGEGQYIAVFQNTN